MKHLALCQAIREIKHRLLIFFSSDLILINHDFKS